MKTIFDYKPHEYQNKLDTVLKEIRDLVLKYLNTGEYNEFDMYRAFSLSSTLLFHAGAKHKEASEIDKKANALAAKLHEEIKEQMTKEKAPLSLYFTVVAKLLFFAATVVESAIAEEIQSEQAEQQA